MHSDHERSLASKWLALFRFIFILALLIIGGAGLLWALGLLGSPVFKSILIKTISASGLLLLIGSALLLSLQ